MMVKTYEVELLVYECPAVGGGGNNKQDGSAFIMTEAVIFPLVGMAVVTESVAFAANIPVRRAKVQTVRKHLVGHGRPPEPKKVVFARCKLLGWEPKNTDESDAMCVWAWAKAKWDKEFRLEAATPLFGESPQ